MQPGYRGDQRSRDNAGSGMDNQMLDYKPMIIFDIETRGLPAEQLLAEAPPFDPNEVAIGNRKTPEALFEKLAAQERRVAQLEVRRLAQPR